MSSVEASVRDSADLRAEMAAIAADLDVLNTKVELFDQKAADLALDVYRKDGTAAGRLVQIRDCKTKVIEEQRLLSDAKAACEIELAAALEREELGRKQVAATVADGFAEAIGPVGARLDELLSEFKREYLKLKAGLSAANQSGHGPTAGQVTAACAQAFFWHMSDRHAFMEFEIVPPAPTEGSARPTFTRYTLAWAGAAAGAATRLRAPPTISKPNGHAVADALRLNGSQPYHVDVGESLPGDPPGFRIYDPGNIKG
jgi:hypothetical protein